MKNEEITNKVRTEIGGGRIDRAFDLMEGSPEIWVNADTRDVVLQLKSNYSLLRNKLTKGIISNESYNIELNVIIDNLLTFLKNVDEVINYHEYRLQSGELYEKDFRILDVPRYLGAKTLREKFKIFFKKKTKKRFTLYLVKTKQYWIIDCPEHVKIKSLSKYVADSIFPNLKEQHFIWKLEAADIKISDLGTIQYSGITTNQHLNLTAEYKHHDELWGNDVSRKIVMQNFQKPPNMGH